MIRILIALIKFLIFPLGQMFLQRAMTPSNPTPATPKPYPLEFLLDDNGSHFALGVDPALIIATLKTKGQLEEAKAIEEGEVWTGQYRLSYLFKGPTGENQTMGFVTTDKVLAELWKRLPFKVISGDNQPQTTQEPKVERITGKVQSMTREGIYLIQKELQKHGLLRIDYYPPSQANN